MKNLSALFVPRVGKLGTKPPNQCFLLESNLEHFIKFLNNSDTCRVCSFNQGATMDTWHCKRCDTSVGEDELECPVCGTPHPNERRVTSVPHKRKGPSTETLNDLAKFAEQGSFTHEN